MGERAHSPSGASDDGPPDEHLTVEVDDSIALVTLNRPPANTLTLELRLRLRDCWVALREMSDVRAVVVTGSGNKYFSTGLDLNELVQDLEDPAKDSEQRHAEIDQLEWDPISLGLWKPVVGAINGYCLAGGFYLATMCDVRIASVEAQFGVPEVRWSHPASFTWSLARSLLPLNVVAELVLWGDTQVPAQRLFDLGFLNAVVPSADVLSTALDWARRVSRLDPVAVERHKEMLYRGTIPDRDIGRRQAELLLRPLHDRGAIAQPRIREFLDRNRPGLGGAGSARTR